MAKYCPVLGRSNSIRGVEILEGVSGAIPERIREMPEAEPEMLLFLGVSDGQVAQDGFLENLLDALQAAQLPKENIALLLKAGEGAAPDLLAQAILQIQNAGIAVWLDDFGEGYSLVLLRRVKVQGIRLCSGLTQDIDRDERTQAMVESLCRMAGRLSASVMAQGADSPAKRDALRRLGVEWTQGDWVADMDEVLILIAQSNGTKAPSGYVRDAMRYMQLHYADEGICIGAIARSLRVSEGHLSHCFKEETGGTVMDYLTKTRIDAAERMLSSGRMRVYEAAAAVGYKDVTYFSRIFRKMTGRNPSEVPNNGGHAEVVSL